MFKNIKYAFQRIQKGYDDTDVWAPDWWFERTFIPMLKEFKKDLHGFPQEFSYDKNGNLLDNNISMENWKTKIDEMINCFEEMTEDGCSERNEYEQEFDMYFDIGNKDGENNISEELKNKYFEREQKIYKYREKMKNKGFKLLSQYFWDLWD